MVQHVPCGAAAEVADDEPGLFVTSLGHKNPGVSGWRWVTLVTQTSFPSNRIVYFTCKRNIKYQTSSN